MNSKEYIDMLSERYEKYFDIYKEYELLGNRLDIFAKYHVINEKSFLSRKAVIYSFENFEYCLAKCFEYKIDGHDVDEFKDYLIKVVKKIVQPDVEHMSTFITGIMVSEKGFTEESIKNTKKFKYSKDFLFTLKGWCDIRLILVNPIENNIVTNKKGRQVINIYAA